MTQFLPSMAEAQAMGLCALARQDGLPEIAMLRHAVAQLHPMVCGWCEPTKDEKTGELRPVYSLETLLQMLRAFRPMAREEMAWWNLPARAKGEAIRMAQGREDAA